MNDDVSAIRASSATHRAPMPARLSIERKLPLIIGALLVVVIAAVSFAAYVEVRRSSMRIATERLASVTRQFGELFEQSTRQARGRLTPTAREADVVEFARTRNPRLRERARLALSRVGTQAEQVVATELRNATGTIVLTTAPPGTGVDTMSVADVIGAGAPSDSATIGRFRLLRDTLVYPLAARVEGTEHYVVRWRRLAGTRRAREQLSNLVGSEATIFIGNADGSRWSDLERPVEGPPLSSSGTQAVQQYSRGLDGARHLATVAPIVGTPWVVAIDFPLRHVLAPVESFLQRMALMALGALAIGLLGAAWMSRQITRPLRLLTAAADNIAAGDYTRRVEIHRGDELGVLGEAFTTMASELQHARANLEHKVEERTRDLNETMRQLHEAQDTLVRREKLAMLGQLASGVGHELRNPLGVMTNAVYYLKTVLSGQPKAVHEYLDILQQQITLSAKIVGDLLDFARSKPPQRKPTSVAEATQAQLERFAVREGIKVENELSAELPSVLVDPVQLGQIILNLMTNASQAIDGGGTIMIRAHVNAKGLDYEVSDTGPGVAPENREKIFEPLFTTKARGIGLGLAVSRTLARANGGDLTIDSTPGEGATFRLTLPLADAPLMTHADARRTTHAGEPA